MASDSVRAWGRFGLVVGPALLALVCDDGALAWYAGTSALIVVLLIEAQRGKPACEKLACWLGVLIYLVAAGYGMASESGAASRGSILLVLAAMAFTAEAINQSGS